MKFIYKALLWLYNWIRKDFQRPKPNTHDFFDDDWDDHDDGYQVSNNPSIQDLSCPKCRHRGSFKIQVKEFLREDVEVRDAASAPSHRRHPRRLHRRCQRWRR